ncbi:hypothetical protein KF840_13160 [bacterium]|nr:hypothetical protein [bacterium]
MAGAACTGGDGVTMVAAMARQPPDGPDQIRGSVWLVTAALALVALAILLLARPPLGARDAAGRDRPAAAAPTGAGAPAGGRRPASDPADDRRPARPVPRGNPAPPPRAATDTETAPPPARAGAPDGSGADGGAEPSGIALFPPPGTNPPKPGLIVPDDFALPPGYVRHHQVTDDGTPLPPILMFNPDFDWVDAAGRAIELPADLVVPPELAPPGMPRQRLEIPPTHVDLIEAPPPGAEFEPADPDR